jgi:hypothetical protein
LYRPDIIRDIDDKNERTFFVLTERKRVKGKVSFYIAEIINGKMELIDNDLTVSVNKNRGLVNEAVNFMVTRGRLDRKHIDEHGYINQSEKNFNIIHVEGTDLTYINF